ncbi:hypothetical protein KZZ52_15280 [Dactylosporangium sp. AC04546]|uniref:hypothetical protein n=1 Tax=Dactylosporangium sp. AC04546 TaxID=2862460 RepID=UPI001EDFE7E4|nr:hypothetical protein [Dactylosporangium sp. AC04546]WVK86669.1 hypothetical protein KZZ52_15280 [Dactylosporangium sp. AC04546]
MRWLRTRRRRTPGARTRRRRLRRALPRGGWSWPQRLGDRGAGVLGSAVAVVVIIGVVGAWQRAPLRRDAPAVSAPAPTHTGPSGTQQTRQTPLWPAGDATPVAASSRAPARFTAVAGVGCRATGEAGHLAVYPAGSVPQTRRGGWSGAGCAGVFWAVPMSGTSQDDPGTSVLWWFAPRGMTAASCDMFVYVPKAERPQDAAGRPTTYLVTRGRDDPTVIGSFAIDQPAQRGRWVPAGRYPLSDGRIGVKMANRGTSTADRHAAAQVSIECARA